MGGLGEKKNKIKYNLHLIAFNRGWYVTSTAQSLYGCQSLRSH